eukprot:GHVQ01029064.1.p1 GENE.GHVQ01029064.1~~GHVQ01029064.1.p1  ORF type:complete len:378 (+),score=44.70 GHVQ01029064.1:2-1135(+)
MQEPARRNDSMDEHDSQARRASNQDASHGLDDTVTASENNKDTDEPELEEDAIEDSIEEHIVLGQEGVTMFMGPFVLMFLAWFPRETEIMSNYGIRQQDLAYYILFAVAIIPFQILINVLIMHAVELFHNVKIYDYMHLCQWRYSTRQTRWQTEESDHPEDLSVEERAQTIHHLAFSEQYYFIVAYYTWAPILLLYGMTILLRSGLSPFSDVCFPLLGLVSWVLATCTHSVIVTAAKLWLTGSYNPQSHSGQASLYRDLHLSVEPGPDVHRSGIQAVAVERQKGTPRGKVNEQASSSRLRSCCDLASTDGLASYEGSGGGGEAMKQQKDKDTTESRRKEQDEFESEEMKAKRVLLEVWLAVAKDNVRHSNEDRRLIE